MEYKIKEWSQCLDGENIRPECAKYDSSSGIYSVREDTALRTHKKLHKWPIFRLSTPREINAKFLLLPNTQFKYYGNGRISSENVFVENLEYSNDKWHDNFITLTPPTNASEIEYTYQMELIYDFNLNKTTRRYKYDELISYID